ncbi:MAG TPA: hypothetical protein VFO10_08085 [Oligoflexus sp.]|uniref:hypothetical protein n=1 Tax=Oligoflexus sp. TaxID=1971216 RepID=UPI002D7F4145|nr:hypothetical protein [Oligoflexus sp.]HET9237195.1 hypothetical protein [Oligoflexus sp.]
MIMHWTFFPIALSLVIAGCKLQTKNARDPIRPSSGDVVITPSAPSPAPSPMTADVEPDVPVPTAKPTVMETPKGCSGESSIEGGDLVLFSGESLSAPAANTLQFKNGWLGNEVWDNGRLQFDAAKATITFGNETIYHGFKLSPPPVNGQRPTFTLTGADVYVEAVRANPNAPLPTFGLRVIQPGEPEDQGGAPTTTWMMDKPSGGSRFLTIPGGCTLIRMSMPATFLEQKLVGNRLIWEMQSNWNQPDMLHIHRIVLKGFQN